jgi:hypothetical protein
MWQWRHDDLAILQAMHAAKTVPEVRMSMGLLAVRSASDSLDACECVSSTCSFYLKASDDHYLGAQHHRMRKPAAKHCADGRTDHVLAAFTLDHTSAQWSRISMHGRCLQARWEMQ